MATDRASFVVRAWHLAVAFQLGIDPMSYVDEIASDEEEPIVVDEAHVARRVEDWLQRLNDLYAGISAWADQGGWSHASGAPVPMHEELMQRVGLPSREQASLVLTSPRGERIWFKPKGLWVIGANGRVDVYTSSELLLLIDTARQFEPAHWVLHHLPSTAVGGEDFSANMLSRFG